MNADRNSTDGPPRPSKKIIWVVMGLLLISLAVIAVQGLVRGAGEASGVTAAAPGDDNAQPAPESTGAGAT